MEEPLTAWEKGEREDKVEVEADGAATAREEGVSDNEEVSRRKERCRSLDEGETVELSNVTCKVI